MKKSCGSKTWKDWVASFAEIAEREGKVERHVRFLAPLAFVSPRIVTAIIDSSALANLKDFSEPAEPQ